MPGHAEPSSTTSCPNEEKNENSEAHISNTSASTAPTSTSKPSAAEIKAQKKAEKVARRQQVVQAKQAGSTAPVPTTITKVDSRHESKQQGGKAPGKVQYENTGSNQAEGEIIPPQTNVVEPWSLKPEDKTVELFRHLYKARNTTIAGVSRDIHPAILALGQQMQSYTICGSNARLVATLLAVKRVIESYITPPGNTLPRHLTTHVLEPQFQHLASCRPSSVSMRTAMQWLKLKISKVDIDESDAVATKYLCRAIDEFIRDRVTLADAVISRNASQQCIKDGDVILTYAKSSIVQQTLERAFNNGRKFKVIVVDSRPLFEGKTLAKSLVGIGLDVKYCLMNGLSHCIRDATKVLLGAHAMMSNGRLFSRIGTAQVAMEANDSDIPVIVLCESVKCTERVALDSIVLNEVAPPDELLLPSTRPGQTSGTLTGWRDVKNLQLLNLMYDVTPADYIAMIVTELGIVPPSSVPVLQRLANEAQ